MLRMTKPDPSVHVASSDVTLAFTANVPRSFFTVVAPTPVTVTQHSAFDHFGLPVGDYMRMARAGAFPTKRVGRLRVARYDTLLEYLTAGARAEVRYREAVPQSPKDEKPTIDPNARVEAERWLAGSRTYAEYRSRGAEIAGQGWALQEKYGPKLWDGESDQTGRPNPDYDKDLYDHGMDIWLAASSIRWPELRRRLIESGQLVVSKPKKRK